MTGQTLKKNISAISLRSASAPRTAPWIINNCCLAPDVSFSGPKTLILYDFNRIKSPVESLLWVRQTRRAILSFCSLSAAEFRGLASCCTWRRFSCCLFPFFRLPCVGFQGFRPTFVFSWILFSWPDRFLVLIASVLCFGGFQHLLLFFVFCFFFRKIFFVCAKSPSSDLWLCLSFILTGLALGFCYDKTRWAHVVIVGDGAVAFIRSWRPRHLMLREKQAPEWQKQNLSRPFYSSMKHEI